MSGEGLGGPLGNGPWGGDGDIQAWDLLNHGQLTIRSNSLHASSSDCQYQQIDAAAHIHTKMLEPVPSPKSLATPAAGSQNRMWTLAGFTTSLKEQFLTCPNSFSSPVACDTLRHNTLESLINVQEYPIAPCSLGPSNCGREVSHLA